MTTPLVKYQELEFASNRNYDFLNHAQTWTWWPINNIQPVFHSIYDAFQFYTMTGMFSPYSEDFA